MQLCACASVAINVNDEKKINFTGGVCRIQPAGAKTRQMTDAVVKLSGPSSMVTRFTLYSFFHTIDVSGTNKLRLLRRTWLAVLSPHKAGRPGTWP